MKKQGRTVVSIAAFLSVLAFCLPAFAFSVYESVPVVTSAAFDAAERTIMPSAATETAADQQSQWTLEDNAIVFNGTAADDASYVLGSDNGGDCLVQAHIALDDGKQAGVFLHYQDQRNYYKVILDRSNGTASVVRVVDGYETVLEEVPHVVVQEHDLYVDFYQDELAVFIDDTPTILVKDAVLTQGKTGFFVAGARHVSFSQPKVEYQTVKKSVLDHLTDMVATNGDMIEFPVLTDKVRVDAVTLKALTLPEGALFEYGSFNWHPSSDQTGDFDVAFEAVSKDGTEHEKRHIRVTVFDRIQAAQAINRVGEIAEETAQNTTVPQSGTTTTTASAGKKTTGKKPQNTTAQTPVIPQTTMAVTSVQQPAIDYSGLSSPTVITGGATPVVTSNTSTNTNTGGGTTDTQTTSEETKAQEENGPVVTPPEMPLMDAINWVQVGGEVALSWSDESASGATIYLLEVSKDDALFADPVTYWVSGTDYTVSLQESGVYYFRVAAYTAHADSGGLGSDPSAFVSASVFAGNGLDAITQFTNAGVFDDNPDASTSTVKLLLSDTGSLGTVYQLHYDVRNQFFTGLFLKDPVVKGHDVSEFKTINYRIRTDDTTNGPIRLVMELKYQGEIKGSVLITDITTDYTDHSFPLYCEGGMIDEITVLVLRDSDPDMVGTVYIDELSFDEFDFIPQSPAVPDPDPKTMTDEKLLDTVESDMAYYFYNETVGTAGFVKDNSRANYASIAATGFGLAAMTILADRYDASDPQWNRVTPDKARARAYQIVSELVYIQETLQDGLAPTYGKAGCFYHFIDGDGKRIGTSEVSTVDTALLVMGAIVAGEYFGGDVKELSDRLFANIDWTFFLNRGTATFYMGWKPEWALDYTIYKDGGFLCNATYNVYTDEIFLITFLAMANHPDDADVAKCMFAFPRDTKQYELKTGADAGAVVDVVSSYYGSLFTYLYAHCFIDFETLGEDKPTGAEGTELTPVDWWQNSLNAIRANKDFCTDRSKYFPFSLDNGNSWGFSACQLPSGRYEGLFGAPPTANGPHHDGTVAVSMPICTLPFFKEEEQGGGLSDNPGFQAMDYYYRHFKNELYGTYGFYDSYNDKGEFSKTYLGIDVGSALLLLENYRSRLIWNAAFMNTKLQMALSRSFSESFNYMSVSVHSIATNGEVAGGVSFGDSIDPDTIASGEQYIRIDYNLKNADTGIAVYTNNTDENAAVRYTGSGNAAGLVGVDNSAVTVPLRWVVFDEPQAEAYQFEAALTEGIMQDASMAGFTLDDALYGRTMVNGNGVLAPYPEGERTTTGSTMYLYLGADFRNVPAQAYKTETITVELYQMT